MKKILLITVCLFAIQTLIIAQTTYTSADYGVAGDSLFYSEVIISGTAPFNFAQAGANQTWNFTPLPPTVQSNEDYLDPKTAGYRADFITECITAGGTAGGCNTQFNSLTNLAFRLFDTVGISGIQFENLVTHDEKSNTALKTTIMGLTAHVDGVSVPFTTTYTSPDVVLVFPLVYGNSDSSVSAYNIDLNSYGLNFIYHEHSKRVNHIDAWGSLTTPYGVFNSTVRQRSYVYHYDTLFYDNTTIPVPAYTSFEYSWFDPAYIGPVFIASGNIVAGNEVYTEAQYIDTVECLKPFAAAGATPLYPVIDPSADSVNVSFTNYSTNANSYHWSFGDAASGSANSSTANDPTHTYHDSGMFTVKLIACNTVCHPEECDTESFIVRVADSAQLRASFNAVPSETCVGDTVSFNNTSANASSYKWNFGDLTGSTQENPKHIYSSPGTYLVVLTASNGSMTDTAIRTVIVEAAPHAVIQANGPTTFCSGDSVILSASGGTTYQWSDGHLGATLVVRTSGTYTVKAINGCGSSTSAPVTVTVNVPVDTLIVSGDTVFCSGDSVKLQANTGSGFTYQWRRYGQVITGATENFYYAEASGNYLVVVTEDGCYGVSNVVHLMAEPGPVAAIYTEGSTVICSGDSLKLLANTGSGLSYHWQLNNVNIPGATSSYYYAKGGGSYTAVVTHNSCSTTSNSIILSVNTTPSPSIQPSGSQAFCSGDSLYLSTAPGNGYTYQWLKGGVNLPGATNDFIFVDTGGSYTVAVTANGCTGITGAVTVTQNPTPIANAGGNKYFTACSFSTDTLGGSPAANGGTGPYAYLWTPAVSLNDSALANPILSHLGTTTVYHLLVTDSRGCTSTDSSTVIVTGSTLAVNISSTGSLSWCSGSPDSVTLTANYTGGTGSISYFWIPSTYLSSFNAAITVASPAEAGNYNYNVVATDQNGCQASATIQVQVIAVPDATVVPLDSTTTCQGDSVRLTTAAIGNYAYQWLQNGNPIPGANTINYTASSSANYSIIASNLTCADTSGPTTITINPLPAASIIPAGSLSFCEGGKLVLVASTGANYSYQWYENGYGIGGATSSFYAVFDSGTFYAVVTLNGCSLQSNSLTDTVNPIPNDSIYTIGSTAFCTGDSVPLMALTGPGYSYQWQFNGQAISGATDSVYTAADSGLYTLMVTALGCSSNSTGIDVLVYQYPTASISSSGALSFCQNDSVILSAAQGAGYQFQWQVDNDTISGEVGPSLTVTSSGSYNVVVAQNGCVAVSNSISADVFPLPSPVIFQSNDTLFASQASTYQWYQDSTLLPGATGEFYIATVSGSYSVVETDLGLCQQSSLPYSYIATGISSVKPFDVISVYPNPAHDAVNILFGSNTETKISISLYDIIGNVVTQLPEAKTAVGNNYYNLSLSDLAQGIYMIRIFDGINTVTKKIVKQ